MRTWFWTVLTITLAVLLAFVVHRFPGNVLIVVDQWRVQVSLAFAIVLVLGVFVALYLALRILSWLVSLPERYRGWRGERQEKKEQSLLEQGWAALLEGRYAYAEKALTRLSGKSGKSGRAGDERRQVLAILSAARAAHEQGESARRDTLIAQAQELAHKRSTDVDLNTAVAAAVADLWLHEGRAQAALDALKEPAVQANKHLHTQRLLMRAHQQLDHHEEVLELARALRRKKAISASEADQLIGHAAAAQLKARVASGDWEPFWKSLRSEEKDLVEVALAGAQAFQAAGQYKESTRVLESALKVRFDARLLLEYARAEPEQVTSRLQRAEKWLVDREDNADLLATLGALCLAAQMWGQAERYLERSAKVRSDARIHALLGSLFDRISQPQKAAQHWRLATAASAALPTLAQEFVLPPADVRADPVITHVEHVEEDNATRTLIEPLEDTSSAAGSVPGRIVNQDYDEFFDSAPIPIHHFESLDDAALARSVAANPLAPNQLKPASQDQDPSSTAHGPHAHEQGADQETAEESSRTEPPRF